MKHFAAVGFSRFWTRTVLTLLPIAVAAQNIPVGTWRTHFSYQNARILEQTEERVFCATENGLFSVGLTDNKIRTLSKIDGLTDLGISSMKYNASRNVLIIGYRSGLVDFVFEDRIEPIEDIFNSNLAGNKQINDIDFSTNEVFLATDLGIVVVDPDEIRIRENFVQIGELGTEVEVKELEVLGNQLFANTNTGIQSGDLSSNLLDFNNWKRYSDTETFQNLVVAGEAVYALDNNRLYTLESNDWAGPLVNLPPGASRLFTIEGGLLSANNTSVFRFTNSQFNEVASISACLVNDIALVDSEYWVADASMGLVTASDNRLSPTGPLSDIFSRIKVESRIAYGFHAPSASSYDGTQKANGYSSFENGQWEIHEIAGFENISDVEVFGNNRYFASIGDGLYDESNDQVFEDLPSSNTELDLDTVITALASNDHLWISSFDNREPIHSFDGSAWQAYNAGLVADNRWVAIELATVGILWLKGISGEIIVFDSEQNRNQRISTASGIPGDVTDLEISLEDNVWVASTKGPATFSDASFIFDFNEVVLPSFENQTLFKDEEINAIETDGGNRVWFGTNRGLWLFDENIFEQVALFHFENSPIPSDIVLDLAFDGSTGELFVLTDKGLVSYRSASTSGSLVHRDVRIFPNPVTPNYTGLIGLTGLARNASVKVTDVNGNLVKEIQANGGAVTWDLSNALNSEVVTGIYLFFSSTPDGEETYVGKIAVIR